VDQVLQFGTKPYITKFTQLRTLVVCENPQATKVQYNPPLRSSEDAWHFAQPLFEQMDADKEHFALITLNNKNRFTGWKVISTGSLTASLVHPREVYSVALDFRAAALIFAHTHPSGDPMPSPEDIEITRRLREVGDIMGIRVLDHIVVGKDRYFSFSDKGML
jgi:DNA repair protein RadC